MNVNVNMNPQGMRPISDAFGTVGAAKPADVNAAVPSTASLTVTAAATPALDVAGAEAISDAEFNRDDPLGRLVSEAFDFPPPPMPDFPSLD